MALNRVIELRLTAAGLTKLYEDELSIWKEMAQRAFAYEKEAICRSGKGAVVRQDDVIPALRMQLEVAPKLRDVLTGNPKLQQKYWYDYFAALIVDRLWKDLNK
jgi:hypothetical protein